VGAIHLEVRIPVAEAADPQLQEGGNRDLSRSEAASWDRLRHWDKDDSLAGQVAEVREAAQVEAGQMAGKGIALAAALAGCLRREWAQTAWCLQRGSLRRV